MEREWGENPLRLTVGVCIECFYIRYRKIVIGKLRRQDIRMRTELSIWCESQDLLWCYLVSAHLHRGSVFRLRCWNVIFQGFVPYSHLNCDSSQKNSAVVIFWKKNCRSFFISCGKKSREVKIIEKDLQTLQRQEAEFAKTHKRDTDKELIAYLVKCSKELGRCPKKEDVVGHTYLKQRLGPWPRILNVQDLKKKAKSEPKKSRKWIGQKIQNLSSITAQSIITKNKPKRSFWRNWKSPNV